MITDRFFYIRDVADEDNDDDAGASAMIPMSAIQGIGPSSTTVLDIWFQHAKKESHSAKVALTVTKGKMTEVISAICSAMNAGPHSDGVVVLADDVTTDYDETTRAAVYLHGAITGCALGI